MAFLFVPLLAATMIVGFLLATVAAHHFLVVLTSTASGADEVTWPDEPFLDWFGRVFYLAFIGGAWLLPALVLGRMAAGAGSDVLPAVITAGVFWLTFPVGMLSSLSASSRWVPFVPSLLARFAQRFGKVVQFYVLSLAVVAAAGWGVLLVAGKGGLPGGAGLVIGGVLAALGWLVYARLLGRLGLVLAFTRDPRLRRAPRPPREKPPDVAPTAVTDPWAGPDELAPVPLVAPLEDDEEDEEDEDEEPAPLPAARAPGRGERGAGPGAEARARRPRYTEQWSEADEETSSYRVTGGAEPPPAARDPAEPPPVPRRPRPRPRRRRRRRLDVLKEPASLFERAALSFLGHPDAIRSFLTLSFGLILLGFMIQMLREFWPT